MKSICLPVSLAKLLILIIVGTTLFSCAKKDKESSASQDIIPVLPENSVEKFIYKKNNDEITITGYSGVESSIVFPSEIDGAPVTAIAENAFQGFLYLKKIVIPKSIKTIDFAFVSCTDLEYVFIGSGVTSMNGAFRGCTSLKTVAGGNNAEYLDESFYNCSSLEACTIPGSAKSALSAYFGCTSLVSATVNNGISSLDKTFEDCSKLEEITLPNSITNLTSAFSGCTSLTKVNGGENVKTYIGAFENCSQLTEITLGNHITELIEAFCGCTSLKKINNMPLSVEKYTASFNGCKSIEEIIIPKIENEEYLLLYSPSDDICDCEKAKNVKIYAEYTVKEDFCKAFSGLLSLENLTLPDSIAAQLLKAFYEISDALYTGDNKDVTEAIKKSKKLSQPRITEDYGFISSESYSRIYGCDVNTFDPDAKAKETSIDGFIPFEMKSYWCGYPKNGNRKNDTVAIERTFSFSLCTTGNNLGTLPNYLTINGFNCAVGEQ
ncbi:MAG: leucine-rich repeat domain-containing protein [Clostridia bacterium]|nr:leucine-rich repeat domain-containing protein [Clostridia bacterium]